ncbi:MAG: sel1 repeat family protein [Archangium sp.]|nr:sel1 repeat family protein [Archangium sp.]
MISAPSLRRVVGVALCVGFVACGGRCQSESVGVDAGRVPEVDAGPKRAQGAPRSCASLEACLAGCDGGVPGACYDGTLFILETRGAARDLTPIAALTSLACERGDGRGCARASRLDDALRLLPAQCEGGDVEACELWYSSALSLDAGVTARGAAARAHALLETACVDQPWACARLGSSLARGRLDVTDVKRGVALLEQACEAGVAGACLEATLAFSRGLPGLAPDPERAAKTGRRARELSELPTDR